VDVGYERRLRQALPTANRIYNVDMQAERDEYASVVQLARLLLPRLERLSPDSTWAHWASGTRGALIRLLEKIEAEDYAENEPAAVQIEDYRRLERLVEISFELLEKSARDLI
jgi:hypothetical protein